MNILLRCMSTTPTPSSSDMPSNLSYKMHQILKLECFSSGLVLALSIEARC